MTDADIYERFSLEHFPKCFKEYADLLTWNRYWHTTLDTSDAPCWKWLVGGKLNVSYNCVDRHLAEHRNKAALIFVPEPEDESHIALTYQELYVRVNEVAALLRDFGLKAGDRVTLHMPMTLELPVMMLACARLGVIHSVVFGGFSGRAAGERIADSGSRILVTMDGYYRILGRVDDVINVAGHRLGTKELESAGLTVPEVAEAAVVPLADPLKGRVPDMYVSLKPGFEPSEAIQRAVTEAIETSVGKIARPQHVYIVPDMPKTRSGKIMRRVLAAISNGRDVGDVTTLVNPDVVKQIQQLVRE